GVTLIPYGIPTPVRYSSVILDSGNLQFFYLGGPCCATASRWAITGSQFVSTTDLILEVTMPTDLGITNYNIEYGAVDGAGQGGNTTSNPNCPKYVSIPVGTVAQATTGANGVFSSGAIFLGGAGTATNPTV